MKRVIIPTLLAATITMGLAGCAGTGTATDASTTSSSQSPSAITDTVNDSTTTSSADSSSSSTSTAVSSSDGILDTSSLFTDRDLEQTADTSSATSITVSDGQDVSITEEGVYVISGTAEDVTITVSAPDDAKVQLVLDGASITNDDAPAIYVTSADKVFVTTIGSNTLSTTGTFVADGDTNLDAVIFSRSDITFNGTGTLAISSSDNGISSKDAIKVTGGTLDITSTGQSLEANDYIAVAEGTLTLDSQQDGLHAENTDDDSSGFVYIAGGTLSGTVAGQFMQATSVVQIDGGTMTTTAEEGIEATYVQVNGGSLTINASDDGINATANSTSYDVAIEITGGDVSITMGSGDTDGLDANGNLTISGGNVDITANSPFDFDGNGEITGGTVTVNGEQVTELTNQMMEGGGMGGAPTDNTMGTNPRGQAW